MGNVTSGTFTPLRSEMTPAMTTSVSAKSLPQLLTRRRRWPSFTRRVEPTFSAAKISGVRKVLLEVAVDNAPAQKLYASAGFEPLAVRRGYYQPSGKDALVMTRETSDDR